MKTVELNNGEARIGSLDLDDLTTSEEVRRGFADTGKQEDHPMYDRRQRCLSFLTSEWLDPHEAKFLVGYIGDYARFRPESVRENIDRLNKRTDHLRIALGRERQPVVYFETESLEPVESVFGNLYEFWEVGPGEVGNGRQYENDDDININPHRMCDHEEGNEPVSVSNYPETSDEYTYSRGWWD